MSPVEISRSSSPSSGWHGRLLPRRPSQKPQVPTKEDSRWSKTTTESELSEAGLNPASKRRNFLKKTKERKKSKDSTKSSPTDPCYNPVTKQLQPFGGDIPPIITTSRPDNKEQPRTFLDDASDDGEVDSPTSPVIQRASSVRVSRPQVIQHNNSFAASVPKLYPGQNTPSSLNEVTSTSETPQTFSEDLFIRLTPAVEKSQQDAVGGPTDALKSLEGETESKDDITALPQLPTQAKVERGDSFRESIVSWPDTPSRLEALDTMPTPMGGFGSMRIPRSSNGTFDTNSTSTYVSPSIMTDGLRANPPSDSEKMLSRAISAPVRNSRRVMIRPADLVISKQGHDHKLFRENIVSTPYPARKSSHVEIGDIMNNAAEEKGEVSGTKTHKLRRSNPLSHVQRSSHDNKSTDITSSLNPSEKAPEIPLSTKPTLAPERPVTAISDRFPSPSAPEILFLDLHLARHPSARVNVEIEITDKTTFDDEQLFTIIRKKYINDLMGKGRWLFCARTLEGASLNSDNESIVSAPHSRVPFRPGHHVSAVSGSVNDFDSADFTSHLYTPRLGHRRKQWLLWLRNAQAHDTHSGRGRRSFLPTMTHTHATPSPSDEKTASPVFSFMQHSRNNSDSSATQEYRGVVSHSKQPSLSLPRMPFTSPPAAAQPGLTSFHRSKNLAMSTYPPSPSYATPRTTGLPRIFLHHTFSLHSIALFTLLTLLLAILTTILWILFGYPGRSASSGDGVASVSGQEFSVPWRRDAQGRVGVGLVLGVVVLLVGGMLEVGWVWGSWVLV